MRLTRHVTTNHSGLADLLRDPVVWVDVLQIVKAVVAAVVAWLVAVHVFGLAQPFLAPWSAMLVVHATVYRTLSRGAQQVGATVIGVLLAFAVGSVLGVGSASLAVVLFLALVAGTARPIRDEGATAATTALVVLLTGYSDESALLVDRLADTAVGIVVGLLVNLAVWAPLRDRSAARQVDALDDAVGELLVDMAQQMADPGDVDHVGDWIERTRQLDEDLDDAWSVVRQAHESGRLNPRRRVRAQVLHTERWMVILRRLEQAIAETRSMARTIGRATASAQHWDPRFREPWLDLLAATGRAVAAADPAAVAEIKDDLHKLSAALSGDDLPDLAWPVYGALLVNLRNIAGALDDVAAEQPVAGGEASLRLP